MNYYYLLFKIVLLLNCFIGVYTKNIKNANYIVAILREKTDKNYDDESKENKKKIDILVNDRMNDIYKIIEKHKNTYILSNGKQDETLNELISKKKRSDKTNKKYLFINKIRNNQESFINVTSKFSKRSNNSTTIEYIPFESKLVSHICPISNFYAISVYLSEVTAKIVCKMKNVLFCEKNQMYSLKSKSNYLNNKYYSNNNNNNNNNGTIIIGNKDSNIYYDINDIKKETQWSDVNVQQISYTPNHLSLISQSPFINLNRQNDTNFYYPASAGKGIDIYLVDMGININHEDFNRYEGTPDERTITCDAIITGHNVHFTSGEEKNKCVGLGKFPHHGIMVSSMAGGTIYGVAKKANLHMIAFDDTYINALRSFDIILQKGKPHKTVISISTGFVGFYSKAEKYKLTDLINKGFIVLVAVGNDNTNCCEDKSSKNFYSYSGYRKVITVGATDTELNGYGLNVADYSNFGDCVDIYGPGTVTYPNLKYDSTTDTDILKGTSCATPLVAGVAASIMSEHPEIQFDNELMRKILIEMSIKNAINFNNLKADDTPNRFINNGKQKIYFPSNSKIIQCGKSNGDDDGHGNICSNGCCTKEGECIPFENYPGDKCFIENGCQSEFGFCTTLEKSIEECEKELKENEECLLEITNAENGKKEIMNQCKIFDSQKCQNFYKKQLSEQSICSIVKKYKKFEYIDDFNINKFNKYSQSCINLYNSDRDKCEKHIFNSYNHCIIDNYYYNDIFDDSNEVNNKLKKDIYFIKQCANIKSNNCQKFYNNVKEEIEKEILSNPSCSFLYENGFTDILDISKVLEKEEYNKGIINFSIDNYILLDEKCETLLGNDSLEICNKELEDYQECLLDNPKYLTINEITDGCYIYYSDECNDLYENYVKILPNCFYAQQFQRIDLINNLKEIGDSYKELCITNPNNKVKEKIISDCEKMLPLNDDECLFDIKSEMTLNELSEKCEKLLSEECDNKLDVMDSIPCEITNKYYDDNHSNSNNNNKDDSIFSKYKLKYSQNKEVCPIINDDEFKKEYIDNCEEILKIYNQTCDFDRESTDGDNDDNDLELRCETFLECQEIFENPFKTIPECQYAQLFKNIEIKFDKSNKYYKYYKERCLP